MLRGFSPQQAVDAPRFCISAGLADAEIAGSTAGDINSIVFFENSFDLDTVAQLKGKFFTEVTLHIELLIITFLGLRTEMGHDCQVISGFARSMVGRAQVIERKMLNGDVVWGAGAFRKMSCL